MMGRLIVVLPILLVLGVTLVMPRGARACPS